MGYRTVMALKQGFKTFLSHKHLYTDINLAVSETRIGSITKWNEYYVNLFHVLT